MRVFYSDDCGGLLRQVGKRAHECEQIAVRQRVWFGRTGVIGLRRDVCPGEASVKKCCLPDDSTRLSTKRQRGHYGPEQNGRRTLNGKLPARATRVRKAAPVTADSLPLRRGWRVPLIADADRMGVTTVAGPAGYFLVAHRKDARPGKV